MASFFGFFRPRSSVDFFLYEELDWEELEREYAMLCCQHSADGSLQSTECRTLSADSPPPDWADLLAKQWMETIRNMYKEQDIPKEGFSTEIVKNTGKELSMAVDRGFQMQGNYDAIDEIPRRILKENVWKFSVAKNYNDCIRLNNLLVRNDGSIRPWHEFKREAMKVVGMSNRYLKTEYDTIIAGVMMSSKWQEIHRDKHIFPFVQFKVVQDNRTSEICSPLHNIICKVDDPFLAYYFPPNHFNCRTDVIKLRDTQPTPQNELPYIDIPKAFLNNVGETGEIFTKDNSYIKNTPKEILDEGKKFYLKETLKVQRAEIKAWAKENLVGKTITHPNIDGEIHFTTTGIKEALNQPHKHILEKNEAIKEILNLIKNAVYIRTDEDSKGRNFRFHYLKTLIKNENSYLIIRENLLKKELSFYSITDKIK